MFDLAILGLLDENDLHGYELRKRLGELPGMGLAVSFGSLYPALGRLEKAGQVKAVTSRPAQPVPTAPMSGSLVGELAAFRAKLRHTSTAPASRAGRGSRGKKVYGITDGGRQRLHELLVDPDVADDRRFALRVAFCRNLTAAERLELFERRRTELIRRRDQRRNPARSDGRVNTYLRSLVERDTAAIAVDLAWLDRLIAEERAASPMAGAEVGADTDTGGNP
ncbi:MAG TPA: PadR family transcriptional regulator [Acidimicrobiales bacterium]|jgi:DNA-binding PadR family transcriptional regulator|nr:PadR family transcriptional regulator [Acidimicrobiales bacterium]